MAEIVNLRARRKDLAKKASKSKANANAAMFGRTKTERAAEQAKTDKAARDLDAHRREDDL